MELEKKLAEFLETCKQNELREPTIKKYTVDISQFISYLQENGKELTKEAYLEYKEKLKSELATSTLNTKLVVINKFLDFLQLQDFKAKQIKTQRATTLDEVISEVDYERLLRNALKLDKIDMYYLMITLAETGIRISELKNITVENIKKGYARIESKSKIREIAITKNLGKQLKEYQKLKGITTGMVFQTRNGTTYDNAYIWKELQYISGQARVKKSKVHAHSFRHLFAKKYLKAGGNPLHLADLLGHNSLETTRIYSTKSIGELRNDLDEQANKDKGKA